MQGQRLVAQVGAAEQRHGDVERKRGEMTKGWSFSKVEVGELKIWGCWTENELIENGRTGWLIKPLCYSHGIRDRQ